MSAQNLIRKAAGLPIIEGQIVEPDSTALVTTNEQLPALPPTFADLGQAANRVSNDNAFADYRDRKAVNTLRAQDRDLENFKAFLKAAGDKFGIDTGCMALESDPVCWEHITYGLVDAFIKAMLHGITDPETDVIRFEGGYAIASINRTLSTVKVYAKLAHKAGAISKDEYLRIKDVSGYGGKEAKRVNERREKTRKGAKKAEHVKLNTEQIKHLKADHPDTPQGRRDRLIMCLLLDHGLRASELTDLQVSDINLKTGEMTFYRRKVDKIQTHKLTADTLTALLNYASAGDMPAAGPLLRSSRRDGSLTHSGITTRSITRRVNELGQKLPGDLKVEGLGAHDGRHSWATRAAKNGTREFSLQEAGGWSSLAMPRRYVEAAAIANEGVKLGD